VIGAPLLEVRGLTIALGRDGAEHRALDDVSLTLREGDAVAIVGGRAGGKSTLAWALAGLGPSTPRRVRGEVRIEGRDRPLDDNASWADVRGRFVGLVPEDAPSSLDPSAPIREQLAEVIAAALAVPRREARARASTWLVRVGLADPERIARAAPHALSSGERRLAAIALALAGAPRVLVADEPLGGLDAIARRRVLALIDAHVRQGGALVLATGDLDLALRVATRVLVLERGRVVEEGETARVLGAPTHAATRALVRAAGRPIPSDSDHDSDANDDAAEREAERAGAAPSIDAKPTASDGREPERADRESVDLEGAAAAPHGDARAPSGPAGDDTLALPREGRPALAAAGLARVFTTTEGGLWTRATLHHALHGVDLELGAGERLGLLGETGAGKSTLLRVLFRLIEPTVGRLAYDGEEVTRRSQRALRALRATRQLALQDPASVLDPLRTARELLAEGLEHDPRSPTVDARAAAVAAIATRLGLAPACLDRRPAALTGTERRLVALGRHLVLEPTVLALDDALSGLDPAARAAAERAVFELHGRGAALIVASHDAAWLRDRCDRIAVLSAGRIVEIGPARSVARRRLHPLTRELFAAESEHGPASVRRLAIVDDAAPIEASPSGCGYAPRCERAERGVCDASVPALRAVRKEPAHRVACFHPGN
jgi:peptide/nickel transport system ATP-binding protein